MPLTLSPIPVGVAITEKGGPITVFFRELWQALIDGFGKVGTAAIVAVAARTSALPLTTLYTTLTAATYRVGVYLEKTAADGVSSSLAVTIGWTHSGAARTHTFAALTTDTVGANLSDAWEFLADGGSDITLSVAYASNTPGTMQYVGSASVVQLQ